MYICTSYLVHMYKYEVMYLYAIYVSCAHTRTRVPSAELLVGARRCSARARASVLPPAFGARPEVASGEADQRVARRAAGERVGVFEGVHERIEGAAGPDAPQRGQHQRAKVLGRRVERLDQRGLELVAVEAALGAQAHPARQIAAVSRSIARFMRQATS